MKKVIVGRFMLEANCFVDRVVRVNDFDIDFDQKCIDKLMLNNIFEDNGIQLIPAISARSNASGIMEKDTFDYIEKKFLDVVKENINSVDGIYLLLHGASEVQEIGSGDHHILREIRKVVGPYLPIGVVCDPHGNLCQQYVDDATIIRSYRESPHTDIQETIQFVCEKLIQQIYHPTGIRPVYRKLPLILGGEQSVSADEPVRSINVFMDEMEKDERILSASWHVGYIRHDSDVAGCGLVVIPSDEKYQEFAERKADELYEFIWSRRHQFHYTGTALQPDEALKTALEFEDGLVFITDSGDNVTSRSAGTNTFVLRQFLEVENLSKKVLFASINDDNCYRFLKNYQVGQTVEISLGKNTSELSKSVDLKVLIKSFNRMKGMNFIAETGDKGGCVVVNVVGRTIDIIIAENNNAFVERQQSIAAGANWHDYDICITKQGYAFPELLADGKLCLMSLTEGDTVQDITKIPFKRIKRPMYPIDNI